MFERLYDLIFGRRTNVSASGSFPVNDPSTPDLVSEMPMPSAGQLKYSVRNMVSAPSNPSQLRSLNCHVTLGHCINKIQERLPKPLSRWASAQSLQVVPEAGNEMNAYYDRRSLRFFFYTHRNRTVFFSDSSDIITHELGHAILDSMRPDFWNVQALEIWSFHEAFSDMVAMFNMMSHDVALNNALAETNGTMRGSNAVSRLAEEVGVLIRQVTRDSSCLPHSLRDPAIEKFVYVDPSKLSEDAPNNLLAAECHSFGRVFSGAWYEIFVRIYSHWRPRMPALEAAKKARDESFFIATRAIPLSPRVSNYFEAVAGCMVTVAKSLSSKHGQIVSEVFKEWNILKKDVVKMLSSTSIRDLPREDIMRIGRTKSVTVKESKALRASDVSPISIMSEGDFEFEVPFDSYYEFDSFGRLVNEIRPDEQSIRASAVICIAAIKNELGEGKMWSVRDGRLERNFII